MTREIRYRDKERLKRPKYIDHGHWGRKTVYWAVLVVLVPIGVAGWAAEKFADSLEPIGRAMGRLRVWSHPCLYGKGPRVKDH